MTADRRTAFPRVTREARLSDKVAELLLRTIRTGGLHPGDRLPSERELGEQFGVSRTVVREAVRSLAAKGVIEVRTGSGLRVAAVEASAVSESMSLFLLGSQLDYGMVNEVRSTLEIDVAEHAAERATDDDLDELRTLCDRMEEALDDVEESSRLDVEFHRGLARATHNPLYIVMLDSIGDVLLEIRRATLGTPGRPLKGVRAHRQIVEAIEGGDVEWAREAMREHLEDSAREWKRLEAG